MWFGQKSPPLVAQARSVYERSYTQSDTGPLTYWIRDESVSTCSGKVAWTIRGSETIHICPLYFNKDGAGRNSRPGILIHELSHTAGCTLDHAYGEEACKELAQNKPVDATENADSFEFYAEDTADGAATT